MSSSPPQVAATGPSLGPSESRGEDVRTSWPTKPEQQAQARDIVRLFQCRICSLPLRDPVTLPCGRSLCRQCLPQTHERINITYPAGPERQQGLVCPFEECQKEHALGDCGHDVTLNKALNYLKESVSRGTDDAVRLEVSTTLATESPDHNGNVVLQGGKLVATWRLAEQGGLMFEAEVTYGETATQPNPDYANFELDALHKLQEEARSEMDCQVCFALFCDPLTTACGHTFCRSCLQRIVDHSRYCPVCRRTLAMNPMLNRTVCPSNERLTNIIETFWKDELTARQEILAADQLGQHPDYDIPLFVCTLSFPQMPTFLHIFEPRYRLMIRRALDADQTFGMVLPKPSRHNGEPHFHDVGTLLRITDIHYYPDGRSLVETKGVSRFRVTNHGELDGYTVGKIERIDDISLEEEEASEALEAQQHAASEEQSLAGDGSSVASNGSSGRKSRSSESTRDVERMSTQSLMDFALAFVERMRAQSVPWLTERMLDIYGECPTDPAKFPWWLASVLPVRASDKYRLLQTSSVRDRLKMCCSWIVEWETSMWSPRHGCVVL